MVDTPNLEKKRKEQREIRQKLEELNANPEEKLDVIQTNFNKLYDGRKAIRQTLTRQ